MVVGRGPTRDAPPPPANGGDTAGIARLRQILEKSNLERAALGLPPLPLPGETPVTRAKKPTPGKVCLGLLIVVCAAWGALDLLRRFLLLLLGL